MRNFVERRIKKVLDADKEFVLEVGDSADIAKAYRSNHFDLIFIDADHSYEATCRDIQAWWSKLKPGGLMIGHDYATVQFPGVYRAVEEDFGHHRYGTLHYDENGGLWCSTKNSDGNARRPSSDICKPALDLDPVK